MKAFKLWEGFISYRAVRALLFLTCANFFIGGYVHALKLSIAQIWNLIASRQYNLNNTNYNISSVYPQRKISSTSKAATMCLAHVINLKMSFRIPKNLFPNLHIQERKWVSDNNNKCTTEAIIYCISLRISKHTLQSSYIFISHCVGPLFAVNTHYQSCTPSIWK